MQMVARVCISLRCQDGGVGHREDVLVTDSFGRGLEIWLWGDWECRRAPRILGVADLEQMKK